MHTVKSEYTKEELLQEFTVLGFSFGFCVVRRKSDGLEGAFTFTTDPAVPRIYHSFTEA